MAGPGGNRDPKKPGYGLPGLERPPGAYTETPANRPLAGGRYEVKPNVLGGSGEGIRNIALGLATACVLLMVAVPIYGTLEGNPLLAVIDIPVGLTAAVGAGLVWLYFHNERAGFADGFVYRVGMFGRRHRWPLHELADVIRVRVIAGTFLSSEAHDVNLPTRTVLTADIVVGHDGRAVQSFTGWPEVAMDGLWQAARLKVVRPWAHPVGVRELRQRYPGAVPALSEPQDTVGAEMRTTVRVGVVMVGCAVLACIAFVVAVVVTALMHSTN